MIKPLPVLVLVEDEPEILEILRCFFEDDFEVIAFSDSSSALEYLKKCRQPDFLLTDLVMPGLNGVELILEVKKIWPFLPVILLTGNTNSPLLSRLSRVPAIQCARKPVDLGDLKQMIFSGVNVHQKF